jgi:hypothetical protein
MFLRAIVIVFALTAFATPSLAQEPDWCSKPDAFDPFHQCRPKFTIIKTVPANLYLDALACDAAHAVLASKGPLDVSEAQINVTSTYQKAVTVTTTEPFGVIIPLHGVTISGSVTPGQVVVPTEKATNGETDTAKGLEENHCPRSGYRGHKRTRAYAGWLRFFTQQVSLYRNGHNRKPTAEFDGSIAVTDTVTTGLTISLLVFTIGETTAFSNATTQSIHVGIKPKEPRGPSDAEKPPR